MTYTIKNSELELNGSVPTVKLTGTESSADPVQLRENAGNLEVYDTSASTARVTIGVATGDTTIAGTGTLAVTTADKLTVAGVIVPQYTILTVPIDAASVDQWIFIADAAYELDTIETIFTVTASGSCDMDLKKSTTVEAPASGASMLTGVIALQATANTVYAGTKHGTAGNRQLADGNTMSLTFSDVATGLTGGIVTIKMHRI